MNPAPDGKCLGICCVVCKHLLFTYWRKAVHLNHPPPAIYSRHESLEQPPPPPSSGEVKWISLNFQHKCCSSVIQGNLLVHRNRIWVVFGTGSGYQPLLLVRDDEQEEVVHCILVLQVTWHTGTHVNDQREGQLVDTRRCCMWFVSSSLYPYCLLISAVKNLMVFMLSHCLPVLCNSAFR